MWISLSHVLPELEKQIKNSQKLITKVEALGIPRIQLEIIAEMAFLRIFIAWEIFLEESFIRYLAGAKSQSGHSPGRRLKSQNMGHAAEIIYSGRDYVKWTSTNEVINKAKIYFNDGEPYKTALQAATAELDEINTIRNRIAHESKTSKSKFNDFIRRKVGHGIRGMTPGRFLLTTMDSTSQYTFLDYYVGIIKTTGKLIVQ